MKMSREMQRVFEKNLPQYALDFLTEEFKRIEDCLYKIKEMEKIQERLLQQISHKDDMIYRMLEKHIKQSESGNNTSSVGYKMPDAFQFDEMYPMEIDLRRGRRDRGRSRSEHNPFEEDEDDFEILGNRGRGRGRGGSRNEYAEFVAELFEANRGRRGRGRSRNESGGGSGGSGGGSSNFFEMNKHGGGGRGDGTGRDDSGHTGGEGSYIPEIERPNRKFYPPEYNQQQEQQKGSGQEKHHMPQEQQSQKDREQYQNPEYQ